MSEAARAISSTPNNTVAAIRELNRSELAKQSRRDRRLTRYEAVMEQVRNGASQAAISRLLDVDRRTVRRWTRHDAL